jgi:hypothetical protein
MTTALLPDALAEAVPAMVVGVLASHSTRARKSFTQSIHKGFVVRD